MASRRWVWKTSILIHNSCCSGLVGGTAALWKLEDLYRLRIRLPTFILWNFTLCPVSCLLESRTLKVSLSLDSLSMWILLAVFPSQVDQRRTFLERICYNNFKLLIASRRFKCMARCRNVCTRCRRLKLRSLPRSSQALASRLF
jgi:hypothetical protein